jgi:Zn finger protein HypA/HybF involved in hydrogenase expression
MHEAGIADRMLDAVLDRVAEAGAMRVDAVVLEMGDECGVAIEALEFHWQEHARGTAADGARLVVLRPDDPAAFRVVALDVDESLPQDLPAAVPGSTA